MRAIAWMVVGAGLLGVPLAVLVALAIQPERLDGLTEDPVPLVEPAAVAAFDERTGVAAALTWTTGPTLHAPAWSGVVGRVEVSPGTLLQSGDAVAVIDGVTRLAIHSDLPFHRALALNSRGPDVAALHAILAELGHLGRIPTDATRANQTTVSAIRALATDLGVVGTVNAFDPGWFVWLPEATLDVATIELTAGAVAPSSGSAIAMGAPELASVGLQRIDGGALRLEADVAYLLAIEGLELPLEPGSATFGAEDLASLAAVVPPLVDSTSGSVTRAQPLDVWALPSAAVMSGPSGGRLCIWVASATGFDAAAVEVVSGRAGVTFIMPPAASADVLQNPAQVLVEPACP
jgi:hypothetical protein